MMIYLGDIVPNKVDIETGRFRRKTDFYIKFSSVTFYTAALVVLAITFTYGFWFGKFGSKVIALLFIAMSVFVFVLFSSSSLLIDAGANMDCTPDYLAQFAVMGEVFAKRVQKKKNPSVGLLSIGGEKSKGNELTLKTFDL